MNLKNFIGLALGSLTLAAGALQADPILTSAGSALGFNLSTVITGAPGSTTDYSILGTAVTPDGNIIFNSSSDGMNYVIANKDNQVFTNPGTVLAASADPGFPTAFAVSNGHVWASGGWPVGGALRELDNQGNTIATFTGIPVTTGIWTNPANGHLIAISYSTLLDIDVSGATPVATVIKTGVYADGLTVSPDGTKIYLGTAGNNVVDLTSPAHSVSNYGPVSDISAPAVISSNNSLNGMLVVSTAVGNIVLIDPVTNTQTILSTGGGYEDYVGEDPTTGSLLLGSSNSILRLSCGTDCAIGSVYGSFEPATATATAADVSAPEPATTGFAALAIAAALIRRRKASMSSKAKLTGDLSCP